MAARFPKYIQALIDSGDVSQRVDNNSKSPSFIDFNPVNERRGVADNLVEALALGYPVYKNDKGSRVTIKATPLAQNPNVRHVTSGKNIDSWGRSNLARNSTNPLRKANARLIEASNMGELEPAAAALYGRISQAHQNDAHHIVGINSMARHIQNMPERRREPFKQMLSNYGLYTGDHPRNLSSIPGERAINAANLHQSVIHTADDPRSVTALLAHYGLPNSTHTTWDLVKDVPRQYNTQREAAALADAAVQRLSVQLAMLNPQSQGAARTIEQSKALIQRALLNTKDMSTYESLEPRMSNASILAEKLRRGL